MSEHYSTEVAGAQAALGAPNAGKPTVCGSKRVRQGRQMVALASATMLCFANRDMSAMHST